MNEKFVERALILFIIFCWLEHDIFRQVCAFWIHFCDFNGNETTRCFQLLKLYRKKKTGKLSSPFSVLLFSTKQLKCR